MTRFNLYVWLFVVFLCIRSTLSYANVNGPVRRVPSSGQSSIKTKHMSILSKRNRNSFSTTSKVQLETRLLAAIDPSLFGGVLSGCLHSVTGPDHLAALLPSSVGKSGWYGAKVGAVWGMGHGISATLLGFTLFFLKDKIGGKFAFLEKITNLAESAVGLSLVAIGLLGVKESLAKDHDDQAAASEQKATSYQAIFANGLLHGFSWDGAPSIAPAIAMTSWKAAGLFFGAYSVGAMITMSIVAGTIAWLSSRMGQLSNNPQLPKKLSLISSLIAVVIGLYWLLQPLLRRH